MALQLLCSCVRTRAVLLRAQEATLERYERLLSLPDDSRRYSLLSHKSLEDAAVAIDVEYTLERAFGFWAVPENAKGICEGPQETVLAWLDLHQLVFARSIGFTLQNVSCQLIELFTCVSHNLSAFFLLLCRHSMMLVMKARLLAG